MPNHRFAFTPSLAITGAVLLALSLSGCGGGDSSSSTGSGSTNSGSGGSTSSSSCNNYKDLVDSNERSRANSCGIQVSGNYGNADSHLQQVIAACQQGAKAEAEKHYNEVYKKAVQYARDVSKELGCGSSNSPSIITPSAQTYYNMCGKITSSRRIAASCYGPVRQAQGGCGDGDYDSYTYISQYSSLSTCISARDSWLK